MGQTNEVILKGFFSFFFCFCLCPSIIIFLVCFLASLKVKHMPRGPKTEDTDRRNLLRPIHPRSRCPCHTWGKGWCTGRYCTWTLDCCTSWPLKQSNPSRLIKAFHFQTFCYFLFLGKKVYVLYDRLKLHFLIDQLWNTIVTTNMEKTQL